MCVTINRLIGIVSASSLYLYALLNLELSRNAMECAAMCAGVACGPTGRLGLFLRRAFLLYKTTTIVFPMMIPFLHPCFPPLANSTEGN